MPASGVVSNWRSGWDSNPRYAFDVYSLSRRAPSTTRPPLRISLEARRVAGDIALGKLHDCMVSQRGAQAAIMLLALALLAAAQAHLPSDPAAADWHRIPDDQILIMTLADQHQVVMRLAPQFAPQHVANVKTLALDALVGRRLQRVPRAGELGCAMGRRDRAQAACRPALPRVPPRNSRSPALPPRSA